MRHPISAPTARAAHLDTLRAIACLALVSYHVVGDSPRSGMELPLDHWLACLNITFIDMRMPLFSFLSGCVFLSLDRLTRPHGQVLLSKARRLLLPMICVGLLFWVANTATGRAQPPLFSLLVMPYAHFWFLQATFVIIACFLLLHWVLPLRPTRLAALLMGLGALAWLIGPRPPMNVFSIIQAAYLMPFFMLGYLCAHSALLPSLQRWLVGALKPLLAGAVLAGLIGLGYALAVGWIEVPVVLDRRMVTLSIGIGFCLSLILLAPQHALLAQLGRYSYTIYLFHVFFTAGSFEVLSAVAPGMPDALIWGAGLLAGLIGPICLHHILMQSRVLSTLFLGLRPAAKPVTGSVKGPAPVAQTGASQRA